MRPLNYGRKTRKEKHSQGLSIAAWNVRTLLDRKTNNTRPKRRTAIVAMELERYGIDIAALSETRFAEDGQLTENNYTFYWKGKDDNEPRMHGAGFAVIKQLSCHQTDGASRGYLRTTDDAQTHRLLITNATFHMEDRHEKSWMHPRSKHWHLLDYVITRQRDRADVLSTRAMAGSTVCSTDHILIRAKVAIRIAPKHRKQYISRRRFDVGKLKDMDTSNQFKVDLQERLLSKPDDNLTVEEHWTHVKTALTDACVTEQHCRGCRFIERLVVRQRPSEHALTTEQ